MKTLGNPDLGKQTLERLSVDTVVIGAGVVGLAVARALALLGHEVFVLEAGDRFGEGLSSRNSEVIHAGIYYPKDSLKAHLCVQGRQRLYEYCDQRKVPYRKCGKWIVGVGSDQSGELEAIRKRAEANGVELGFVEAEALHRRLPGLRVSAALYSAETGIIDSHQLMLCLLADLEAMGGQLICQAPVVAAQSDNGTHLLTVGGAAPCQVEARHVVNAAGLGAVPLAGRWEGYPQILCPTQYFARGVYFSYNGAHPFNELIYPLPEPGGLGIHLTLDLAGQARFGPDVEWIERPDFTVDPRRAAMFAQSVQAWWPGLRPDRLQPAYAGVRPKLSGPGEAAADFDIQSPFHHGVPGLVHLFGIESPGLTSCLSLADYVAACIS